MKQSIEKNVKYILDNIDDLDLSPIDKDYIDRIVKYLKFGVKYNLIHTNLIENEKIVKQIENTIKLLETQDDKLSKEIEKVNDELIFKYEEYKPTENKTGVYAGLQARVEEAKKKNYEERKSEAEKEFELKKPEIEQKLAGIRAQKDNITALRNQIVSTESFIDSTLNDELDVRSFKNDYQSLLNDCARTILGKYDKTENGLMLFDYDEIESNYTPKIDELKEFFEYARKPEVAEELTNFYNKLNPIKENKNIAEIKEEKSEKKLSKREDIKAALFDKFEQKNVEDGIFDIVVSFDNLKKLYKELFVRKTS